MASVLTHCLLCILGCTLAMLRPGQTPSFRSNTELLALDVTVVDRNGRPVPGLTASDFLVEVAGKRATVEFIDFVRNGSPHPVNDGSSQTGARSSPEYNTSRVIVLLIDDLSIRPGDEKLLLFATARTLKELDPQDLVGVTTTSGAGPVLAPTADRNALAAALQGRRLVGQALDTAPVYVTVMEALEIEWNVRGVLNEVARRECSGPHAVMDLGAQCADTVRSIARRVASEARRREADQMRAVASVIEALKAAPKPRILILLTAGIAVGADREPSREMSPVTRAAAAAGVQLYALTEISDPTSASESAERARSRYRDRQFLFSGVQTLATAVGGIAFRVIGQPDRFVRRILNETSAVYRLGVNISDSIRNTQLLEVKVTLAKRGLTVRTIKHVAVRDTHRRDLHNPQTHSNNLSLVDLPPLSATRIARVPQ